jgi:hypothetical protein
VAHDQQRIDGIVDLADAFEDLLGTREVEIPLEFTGVSERQGLTYPVEGLGRAARGRTQEEARRNGASPAC